MKPATNFIKSSTPISTTSSAITNNAVNLPTTAVQSGPYTKAQFQNTMEGSRSVKNTKEIEQLLRDYPAALELYRTGRYKVKIKNEADIERVILVEKRTNKNQSNTTTKTNDNQSIQDISNKIDENIKKERNITEASRSHLHSQDRVAQPSSSSIHYTDSNNLVQTTTSSMHTSNYNEPKVEQNRASSKDHDTSLTSQSKTEQKQKSPQRSQSRDDSRSKVSHSKHKGKKNHRDHTRALVPYVPNGNSGAQMWHQSRALQPYYSNPIIPQPPISNMYMPTPYGPQQNSMYSQPYYYGQTPFPALVYQQPSNYPLASTVKSGGSITNPTLYPSQNYASSSSNTGYNPAYGSNIPPSFPTFQSNQQQYPLAQSTYPSQLPYQMPVGWPAMTNRPGGPVVNDTNLHGGNRRSSKHRARSVDTGARTKPPVNYYNQAQPPAPAVTEHHHHHHRHHHQHRSQPPAQTQNTSTGPYVDVEKVQNIPLNGQIPTAPPSTTTTSNTATNGEKLTIRQLNEIFTQMDPSGRLPYTSLPNILQRFGLSLGENDLMSAAQNLGYNTTETISARRLVHVLVKLGKIAKSAQQQQQQRPNASPTVLPEDREVNEILTQRRTAGVGSTHIHSSVYPNRWY